MKSLVNRVLGKEEAPKSAPASKPTVAVKEPPKQLNVARPQPRPHQVASPAQNAVRPAAPQSQSPQRNTAVTPVTATSVKQRNREPTPEELNTLLNFKGVVLTGPGGTVALTESQAQYIALLGGENVRTNVLVVAKSHAMHHEASSARSQIRKAGLTWGPEFYVDLDIIRKIYQRTEIQTPQSVKETGNMQREFIQLLAHAASINASDIHITVKRYEAEVRIRADGIVTKFKDLTAPFAAELCSAAFAMADASDPQYMLMEYQGARVTETSMKGLKFPEGVQSVRLQFNPLPAGGRYMIARLLYSKKLGSNADIDELGYAPNQIRQIKEMRRKPYGINLISGPTGSGKSTTLQRGLTALMREKPGINVVTIEDPPEYVIEGAAQLPVVNARTAEERAEKFRQAITAALRSDPDVIMIGEIRDLQSAHLAFEAAMTGHGVWSSVHANDAPSIVDRLRDMGVELYKLGDGSLVTGLIGQILVRQTKQQHAITFEEALDEEMIDADTEAQLRYLADGYLDNLRFAGTHKFPDDPNQAFSGRAVVAEVIAPDQEFLNLIKADEKVAAIQYWIDHLYGMTKLEHAFALVLMGKLDVREMQAKVGILSDIDKNRIPRILALVNGEVE